MKLNKYKKEIIEFFQSLKPIEEGVYESDLEKFEDQFGKDSAYTKNLDTLIANGIINKNTKADRVVLTLFERDHRGSSTTGCIARSRAPRGGRFRRPRPPRAFPWPRRRR